MIDLSLMKGVHVNAAAQTAVVEGGVTWRELNRETQLHGLATTGGVIGRAAELGRVGAIRDDHDMLVAVDAEAADQRLDLIDRRQHAPVRGSSRL